jgi:hypothetical protein
MAGKNKDFRPQASEIATAVSVDSLVAQGAVKAPTLVKIDVDGNELPILQGMKKLLTGPSRPRSVQVEINVGEDAAIKAYMAECGYAVADMHFTRPGEALRKRGIPTDQIAHNAIFQPKA